LLTLLKENKIPVVKAGIGNINKTDIISAKANVEINELDAIVAGFNVEIKDDANKLSKKKIKVITDDIIYKLIVKYSQKKEREKQRALDKKKREQDKKKRELEKAREKKQKEK